MGQGERSPYSSPKGATTKRLLLMVAAVSAMVLALAGCSSPAAPEKAAEPEPPAPPDPIVNVWEGDATLLLNSYKATVEAKEDGTISLKTEQDNHTGNSIGVNFDGTWEATDALPNGTTAEDEESGVYNIDFNGVAYYAIVVKDKKTNEPSFSLFALNDKNEVDLTKVIVTATLPGEKVTLSAKELEKELKKQDVKVTKTEYIVQNENYKNLYPDFLKAVVKNNSGKKIKHVTLGFVAWDKKGLPVKIHPKNEAKEYYYIAVTMDNANILDGEKWAEQGVALSGNEKSRIDKFKAIVVDYTDFDGNTWKNPLLENWQGVYENKPLD